MPGEIYRIRNWERFQHYSKRRPRWIKLHVPVLNDRDVMSLDLADQGLLFLLWVLASEEDGVIPADVEELSWRLRRKVTATMLQPLIKAGFLVKRITTEIATLADASGCYTETETDSAKLDFAGMSSPLPVGNDSTPKGESEGQDPPANYPELTAFYPRLLTLIGEAHPKARVVVAASKGDREGRETLSKLARLDRFSEDDIIGALEWVLTSENADAQFWRRQVAAVRPLRNTCKSGLTKFAAIHERWKESAGRGAPDIELRAASEKARRGAQVPLPASFAALLGEYIAERRSRLLGDFGARGGDSVSVFPGVSDTASLFEMPGSMMHAFEADLNAAGIAKTDAQGRVLDIHALRHSFCTMVAQSGVSMQHAQRLMRHATPAMTARYTHLTLTDLGGAIAALPGLPKIAQPAVVAAGETTSKLRPHLRPHFGCISSGLRALSCTDDASKADVVDVAENGKNPGISRVFGECKNGSGGRDRTADTRIMIPLLYQLSYAATTPSYQMTMVFSNLGERLQERRLEAGQARGDQGQPAIYMITSHSNLRSSIPNRQSPIVNPQS